MQGEIPPDQGKLDVGFKFRSTVMLYFWEQD
jgi:hypothetical protein